MCEQFLHESLNVHLIFVPKNYIKVLRTSYVTRNVEDTTVIGETRMPQQFGIFVCKPSAYPLILQSEAEDGQ